MTMILRWTAINSYKCITITRQAVYLL